MPFYYEGRMVDQVRYFNYGAKLKAEFYENGERIVVDASEVSNESHRGFDKHEQEKVVEKSSPQSNLDTEVVTHESETSLESTSETSEVKEVITEDGTVEPEPEYKAVVAIKNSNNKKTTFNSEGELTEFANKNKLDPEAIQRVLDGEQKTHKGFSFSYK